MVSRLALIAVVLVTALGACKLRTTSAPAPMAAGATAVQTRPLAPPPRAASVVSWLPAMPPGAGRPSAPPYLLDSGDRLRIAVFGEEHLTRGYSVDGSGFISMPLIGAVLARGVTTFELERRIADQLQEKYVKDPQVTVEVEAYRPFFILGEVRRPGQYPYVSGMTVETAVAIAGGYTERARERSALLTRRYNGRSATIRAPSNAPVLPGDTIKVMERFF